jgi:transcriptional regulator with XRE-family HTH domain
MRIDLKLVGKRIREVRGKLALEEFGEILGISRAMVSKYERGEAWPKPDVLSNIAECGKVSFDWLLGLTERGPTDSAITGIRKTHDIAGPGIPEGYVKSDVYLLGGAGAPYALTSQEPIDTIFLPQKFLKPSIVPIQIAGRSMEPILLNGAFVGVDKTERKVVSGEVYAVYLPYEGTVVKRLYMSTDHVILKSDNPSFPELSIPIDKIDPDNFILGRVKWVLQEF